MHRFQNTIISVAIYSLLLGGSTQIYAQNAVGPNPQSVRAGEPVTLNFANAEIEAVARTMATITGRNVVVDPRVKGNMTLTTERPVSPAVAFEQFLAALRLQGFTVVDANGLYKVVPEAEGKLQGSSVRVWQNQGTAPAAGGQIVTQIFKLNYETAANLVPILRPLISPNNTINVNPGNNSLVITDYADNLARLGRIIATMDVSNASDVEIIPLKNAVATDLAPLVARLIEGGGTHAGGAPGAPGVVDSSFKTTLLADPHSNALILRAANPARLAQVRALVQKLDQPPAPGSSASRGNIHVVYLKNADATKLATTLRAAMAAGGGGGGIGGSSSGASGANTTNTGASAGGAGLGGNASSGLGQGAAGGKLGGASSMSPSTGGLIQADPATNSLIITAPEPLYRQLRTVIDQLDGPRAQVLVESLIVEVTASKVADFGIQWQGLLGKKGDGTIGVIGTNSDQAGANIVNITAGLANGTNAGAATALGSLGKGLNLALAPRINGQYYLGALANFLQNSGDANVLSTPNLMTLDNEEARIIIGNNVPFVTGSYAASAGTSNVNPFTTVERKDVGLMLRVRPQISADGTVKMSIYQEISKIEASTLKDTNGPTTSKRAVESNVVVNDGNIIVIGGLLEDAYGSGEDRVPLLGDVPVVGNIFRSENRSRRKTNLMIFLRPTVVRGSVDSNSLTLDRYDAIRALQQRSQPEQSLFMNNVNASPVLEPYTARALPAPAVNPVPDPAAPPPQPTPAPTPAPANAAPAQQSSAAPDPNAPVQTATDDDDAHSAYYLNIGYFANASSVRTTQAKLAKAALPVATKSIATNKGQRTRVRVGPYTSLEETQAVARTIRDMGLEAVLVHSQP